jgi:hypothetical protein
MYRGKLYYEGEDNYVTVHRFIEREAEAAISVTTTWNGDGEWTIDATAQRIGDTYKTPPVHPKNKINKPFPHTAVVSITVSHRTDLELEVVGTWSEAGETYKFEGDLEKFHPGASRNAA